MLFEALVTSAPRAMTSTDIALHHQQPAVGQSSFEPSTFLVEHAISLESY
ncbi:hypothetical protein QTH89_13100 [Variovorax sp. J22G21]|nr:MULTISPECIES: hypothetical protein [unclassified Variovorax]MDM0040770.1 hypothetical protein [Variovorax sp. J22R193]MDM0059499.1 hypothetical protein [Variovorax sp. J22G47]MDM0062143.1 hypothetical protein [Variovorax sp. J22G21]